MRGECVPGGRTLQPQVEAAELGAPTPDFAEKLSCSDLRVRGKLMNIMFAATADHRGRGELDLRKLRAGRSRRQTITRQQVV